MPTSMSPRDAAAERGQQNKISEKGCYVRICEQNVLNIMCHICFEWYGMELIKRGSCKIG